MSTHKYNIIGAALGGYLFPLAGEGQLPMIMMACAVISIVGAVLSEYFINLDDDEADQYKVIPADAEEARYRNSSSNRGTNNPMFRN